jgi:hypothetical protein
MVTDFLVAVVVNQSLARQYFPGTTPVFFDFNPGGCRELTAGSDLPMNAPTGARYERRTRVKFMLMMHAPRGKGDWATLDWPPAALKAHIDFMIHINKELSEAGELVSAEGLAGPDRARIVRAGKNNSPEVTDGPYPEAKEFLAGFWIVDCDSPDRAYEIAARISSAPGPDGAPLGIKVEVREVMSAPPVEV